MARLQSISAQIDLAIRGTQEEVSRAIVATARREHQKIMRAEPQPTGFTRIVDGVRDAALERVNRVVVFEYQRLDLVVQFAMESLFEKSPVLSGEYRNAHTLFVDGVAARNLEGWKPGDTIVIANFLPYSRKIEIGKMEMRVPGSDHVYEQAAQIVNARFGNLARTRFSYTGVIGGAVAKGKDGGKSENRYPCLVITER